MKSITLKYLSALCITALVYGCSSTAKEETKLPDVITDESMVQLSPEQAKQINLQVEEVQPKNIGTTLKLSGQVDAPPQNLVSVSVPLGGYLKSTDMLPGTEVRKGQLLAVIEDPQYIQLQQDYLSTKNKLVYAGKEYSRQQELNRAKAASDKVLQMAETEFRTLNIEHKALAEKLRLIGLEPAKLTENNISRAIKIYSPINGYVSKVNVNIGKYVVPSDILFELVNPNNIYLALTVFERDLNRIKIGQEVSVYSNTAPDKKYSTKVKLVSRSLSDDRSAIVHCNFMQPEKSLLPGMYMNAEVHLDNATIDALPDEAIVNFENKDYVFTDEGNSMFKMTEVSKGNADLGYTAIDTALEGKKIVVKGAYSLLMKLKNTMEE